MGKSAWPRGEPIASPQINKLGLDREGVWGEVKDESGEVIAEVRKLLHFRRKDRAGIEKNEWRQERSV